MSPCRTCTPLFAADQSLSSTNTNISNLLVVSITYLSSSLSFFLFSFLFSFFSFFLFFFFSFFLFFFFSFLLFFLRTVHLLAKEISTDSINSSPTPSSYHEEWNGPNSDGQIIAQSHGLSPRQSVMEDKEGWHAIVKSGDKISPISGGRGRLGR